MQSLTEGEDSWSLTEAVQCLIVLTHSHGLSSLLTCAGLEPPALLSPAPPPPHLKLEPSRKSIEFLDIVDSKALERKVWKQVNKNSMNQPTVNQTNKATFRPSVRILTVLLQVQKELKRKRSFSEGEISKAGKEMSKAMHQQTKAGGHAGKRGAKLGQQAKSVAETDLPANTIRVQVSIGDQHIREV